MARCAGILFLAENGQALFLKRCNGGDHPGEWCFPGGHAEGDETAEQCAIRETAEETGFVARNLSAPFTRTITAARAQPPGVGSGGDLQALPDPIDFTTFLVRVKEPFVPTLCDEHTAFAWVDIGAALNDVRADDANFVESEHPRDGDGKFSTSGSGGKSSHERTKVVEGRRVTESGASLPEHIQSLKIPPAWTDVTYSSDPKASLLATGKDSKGRPQAIYSAEFSAKQAAAKFSRINELIEKIGYISDQNEAARKSSSPRVSASADCAKLIMTTGIRPGSETDTGAKVKAYGATTLEGKHVVINGESVTLKFVGKKGVSLNIPVTDPDTAEMLRERKSVYGDDGQLFPISEKNLLDHVHTLDGGGFKSKDFRTLLGTRTAMEEVAKAKPPTNMAEYKKAVMAVAKTVSSKLGNTPTIALAAYINPSVFADWRIAA